MVLVWGLVLVCFYFELSPESCLSLLRAPQVSLGILSCSSFSTSWHFLLPNKAMPWVLRTPSFRREKRKKWKQIQKHTALKTAKFRLPPTSKEINSKDSNNSQKKRRKKRLALKTIQLPSLKFICFSSFRAVWSRASQPIVCEHPCLQALPWGSWLLQREESLGSEVRFREARSSLPVSPSPCQSHDNFKADVRTESYYKEPERFKRLLLPLPFKKKKKCKHFTQQSFT